MLIYDLDLPGLTKLLKEWKEPAYRAKQVWQGLYQHLYDSPEQFTTLSKPLREKLKELDFIGITPSLVQDSSDGQTRKTLFKLPDGHLIEAVLMHYDRCASPRKRAVPWAVSSAPPVKWDSNVTSLAVRSWRRSCFTRAN
jgi:adenine C2-methylase RlmN of 23S rRNA A2503 and tRNA A37